MAVSNILPEAVTDRDLPALFIASDYASKRAQGLYLRLLGADLAVMVVASLLGAISFTSSEQKAMFAMVSAGAAAVSMALTIALKSQKLTSTWYNGRAVAESAKTAAWRYMTGAEPYEITKPPAEADSLLTKALDSFLKERRALAGSLVSEDCDAPAITPRMIASRTMGLRSRVELYLRSRIGQQRGWYAAKASQAQRKAEWSFAAILATQTASLLAAITLVRQPEARLNLVGVFASLGAALIAWTQLKKYEELATAYGLAAQELTHIAERGRHVESERALSEFVLSAEDAISREHTLWRARRDQV